MKNIKLRDFLALTLLLIAVSCGHKTVEEWKAVCQEVSEFKEGFALCNMDGKWFFIDENGRKISGDYDGATQFANGYALVFQDVPNGCWIAIDKEGNEVCKNIATYVGPITPKGHLWIHREDIHKPIAEVTDFSRSNSRKVIYANYRLVDLKTDKYLTEAYNLENVADEGVAVVSRPMEEKIVGLSQPWKSAMAYAIIDDDGRVIVPYGTYTYIGNFENGMACYSTTGYYEYSIQSREDGGRCMLNDRIDFRTKWLIGYIDTKGTIAIPEQFHVACHFDSSGHAKAYKYRYYDSPFPDEYIIDKEGNIITE
ncbi:MAG: WG repeat-containing protein [Prevotella sp.]|nr:WG repeat-containing protein [Prevotella sp.]